MNLKTQLASNGGDWIERFLDQWKWQTVQLKTHFAQDILEVKLPTQDFTDVPVVFVRSHRIFEVLAYLKNEPGFEYGFLADLTATDELPRVPRFDVVYNLFSPVHHWRIRVKTAIAQNQNLPTIIALWAGANWAEREVFDMYGIYFDGHPDLRRILNDNRFQGFPLRKDYPLRGYQIFDEAEPIHTNLLENEP